MMPDLSPTTKALLRAARSDGPTAAARAKILGGIASGTGAAAGGAAAGAAAKATVLTGSAKLLVAGALFGSAVTVGIAAMVLHVGTPKLAPEPAYAVHADPDVVAVAPAGHGPTHDEALPPLAPRTSHLAKRATLAHERSAAPPYDALAREAALVAEARSALVRGEPDVALGALRAAEALPARAMEPEELSLRARALRASGHDAEATLVEDQLRARFPDNALAR
jgi:hypothetical protein